MKKTIKIILVIVALALVGGWIYWQQHKKSIIKNQIENAVAKGTDSLYFIHYDSSSIDEVNGNASFYNVTLQSDSLQKQLLQFDTASSSQVYNVRIAEVSIQGANIPGLLSNTSVDAKSIKIVRPVIYIISSGKKEKKEKYDSRAIYQKLLGKFNSIRADEIIIENGMLYFADKTGQPNTALKDISIQLKKFGIDSTKDYQNIVSYFIKDVVAKVKEVYVKTDSSLAVFTDAEYNAPGRFIHLKNFQQKNSRQQIVFDVNNTTINNISTDSFILNQQLKAEELISGGGTLTFFTQKKANTENDEIEIDNNYFDQALLNKVSIGNTKVLIYDKAKPGNDPLVFTNAKFIATDIQKLYSGTSVRNLISTSNWVLSADGFSYMSANKRYKMNIGAFDINNATSTMHIKSFTMVPVLSEEAFSKSLKYQEDMYNLNFRDIELKGINTRLLLTEKRLEAETATLQPEIKIYRDRTVAPNMTSKVGNYPHQQIQKIKLPFSVKKITVKNAMVAYKEKSDQSKKAGVVFFKNINATITNATNIKDLISKNNLLTLDATGSFLGVSQMHTVWKLPLNTTNGAFDISGTAGAFDAPALNPLIEPLAMASMKEGHINKLVFELKGDDLSAKGTATLLYDNLKIDFIKNDSGDVKKKGFVSLIANVLIKDQNPKNGVTRTEEINYQRDTTKSFFNLVWKSIYSAAKKTVMGKNAD